VAVNGNDCVPAVRQSFRKGWFWPEVRV